MKRLLLFRLVILNLIIAVLIVSCVGGDRTLHGSPYNPPRPAPGLNLLSTSGSAFQLSAFRGEILLVYFGYTYCPDVCPTTLADVKVILEDIGPRTDDIHLIMVTVDPERDTLAILEDYLSRFHPGFLGLRGEGPELEKVMSAYGVFAQKEPSDDPERYFVSHTARLFLIDQAGRLRTNYPFGTAREDILADLETLLEEGQ